MDLKCQMGGCTADATWSVLHPYLRVIFVCDDHAHDLVEATRDWPNRPIFTPMVKPTWRRSNVLLT